MPALPIPARRAAAPVEIELHEGFATAIDEAAAAADPHHAFLRAGWFAGGAERARTLFARSGGDGRVVAALPTIARPGALPIRVVPGSYWPYRSFPVAQDASDEELTEFLGSRTARAALGPVWRLGPVYEDDPTILRLRALAPRIGWHIVAKEVGTVFVVDLAALNRSGDWPRGSTLKKNRYFEKQLSLEGELDWLFLPGTDWTSETFDRLAAIEAASWVSSDTDRSGAKFVSTKARRSWEMVRRNPALARMMSAAILSVGGRPAAFSFDLDVGDTKYIIANSYDPAFARHSPGRVLAYRNLALAAAKDIGLIDWGAGDPGYKQALGAVAGPRILDLLFVRNPVVAAAVRRLWTRAGR